MRHLLGVDLEDWYLDVAHTAGPGTAARALERQLDVLAAILDATATRATFFVLGITAQRYPSIVRELARRGHEIASHGFAHQRLEQMSADDRRDDVVRSVAALSEITGSAPLGYRAPYFSVDQLAEPERFYDVLRAAGLRYSSSCRARVPRTTFTELPVSSIALGRWRMPVGGGGFWRALPRWAVVASVGAHDRRGERFVAYLHPHELDPCALAGSSLRHSLWVNTGRTGVTATLGAVLARFRFGSFASVLACT